MLVTGSIVIAPDGSVRSHTLDQAEKLSPTIVSVIDKAVFAGRLAPVVVDGNPATERTQMHLRLIADGDEHGNFVVRVGGASFTVGEPDEHAGLNAITAWRRGIRARRCVHTSAPPSIRCSRSGVRVTSGQPDSAGQRAADEAVARRACQGFVVGGKALDV